MNKRWKLLNNELNKDDIKTIRTKFGVTSAMAVIMLNRGITADEADVYLNRDVHLSDPFLLKDMDRACDRINLALKNKEKITVYGDYDVDGVTSIAVVLRYLKSVGADCDFYIPSRDEEGYGINTGALDLIAESGTKLLITVDTGITAVSEAEYAKSIGLDMVITDHHTVKEELPRACAVVNPKRGDCSYPFKDLSGAGVAFKLVCALDSDEQKIFNRYSDLVAISAIADVVPIKGENRTIVYHGMEKIKTSPNIGVLSLIKEAKLDNRNITSKNLAFGIAPRINAAGRIDSPILATKLLLTDNMEEADKLSAGLNATNEARKKIGEEIYVQAEEDIKNRGLDKNKVIVVARDNWHQGVIGIIASKLTEKYNRTVILLSAGGDCLKGSGRSIEGFNLFDALNHCKDLLIKFGGHDRAAGLSLSAENLDIFAKQINAYADKILTEDDMIPNLNIDMPLELNGSLIRLLEDMEKLEPYGVGNEQPVFAIIDGQLQSLKYSKDGKHIFLKIQKNGKMVNAVGFGMGNITESDLKTGTTLSIAAKLYKNMYNGNVFPQFQIIDIRW